MFHVKEIFYTLQGEGRHAGKPAVFLRFTGCNLWSGRDIDRQYAKCKFCDTDFVGRDGVNGGLYDTFLLANKVDSLWPIGKKNKMVVLTGGEPGLQVTEELVSKLKEKEFFVAIETNGTIELPDNIDWVCVSPKAGNDLVVKKGDELKLVFPQGDLEPDEFTKLEFFHFSLQPKDDAKKKYNTLMCIDYCQDNPKWNLSLQTHKIIGIL